MRQASMGGAGRPPRKRSNWHLPWKSKLSARISSLCSFSPGSRCPGWSRDRTELPLWGRRHGCQGLPGRPLQNLSLPFNVDDGRLESHQGGSRSFHVATVSLPGPDGLTEERTFHPLWGGF